jgi:exopolysaccharide biosynthesis polyprenyl glycosylphosphotransferase
MRRGKGDFRVYQGGIALADLAAVGVAVLVVQLLTVGRSESMITTGWTPAHLTSYKVVSLVIAAVWLAVLALASTYSSRVLGSGADEFKLIGVATGWTAALVAVACFLTKSNLSRQYFLLVFAVGVTLLLMGRYVTRQMLHAAHRAGKFVTDVVVVGGYYQTLELIEVLQREAWTGYRVVGVCLPETDEHRKVSNIPVVGDTTHVREALQATLAEAVFLTSGAGANSTEFRRISWQLEGTGADLAVLPSITDVAGPRIRVRPLAGLPLLHLELPAFAGYQRVLKRLLDIVAAVMGLVLLSPVVLVIAVAIKLGSPGPVFFRQIRVGQDGREFWCLKFRTMVVDAERRLAELAQETDGNGLLFKMREDPRVTSVGRRLRRYSLDELPQLVNILRGDMSVVGPRPPLPSEVANYTDDLRRRLLVRPGLTGLWQVSGRSDLSLEESTRLDLYYVDNWSLMHDIEIVWKTLRAVVDGKGAY